MKEKIESLVNPILKVWDYIAPDAGELCESHGEAVEMCIDAGRLSSCAEDSAADALLTELVRDHGYAKVMKALEKAVPRLV